ncbi:uncharacterized protein LOC141911236 [Tubulanus polymorphus]|uniref:uncharacterized protein LOC141911236 n=1 Tax=Tubulanus polymorphus TaxID=672921 RepID=UPI003DA62BA2
MNATVYPHPIGYTKTILHPVIVSKYPIYRWFYYAYQFTVLSLGSVGNVLIVFVMSTRKLRRLSYSRFFIALAISDFIFLTTHMWTLVNTLCFHINGSICIPVNSWFLCAGQQFYNNTTSCYGPSLLIMIGVERLCIIRFPFSGPSFWTPTKTSLTAFLTFVICAGISLFLLTVNSYDDIHGCYLSDPTLMTVTYLFIVTIQGFNPTLSLIFITACIFYSMNQMKKKVENSKSNSSANQATIMVASVCVFFIVTSIPLCVILVLIYLIPGVNQTLDFPYQLSALIQSLNYSMNFYLYIYFGREIRRQFLVMCGGVCASACCAAK